MLDKIDSNSLPPPRKGTFSPSPPRTAIPPPCGMLGGWACFFKGKPPYMGNPTHDMGNPDKNQKLDDHFSSQIPSIPRCLSTKPKTNPVLFSFFKTASEKKTLSGKIAALQDGEEQQTSKTFFRDFSKDPQVLGTCTPFSCQLHIPFPYFKEFWNWDSYGSQKKNGWL